MEMVNNHETETLWVSNDNLNEDGIPYFSVKRARGYYVYGERLGKDSIAFILYDGNTKKFCLIDESKPPLDESFGGRMMQTTAFGGSMDMNKEPEIICQIETVEEAGYVVPQNRIINVGSTMVSTQMSQICVLFLVDVTDIEKTEKAEHETIDKKNSVVWITYQELMNQYDWKSIYIASKAKNKGLV